MKKNDERDNELDQLLQPLKSISPNELQIQKWQSGIQSYQTRNNKAYFTSKTKWALQLVASMFIGVIIGAMAFKSSPPPIQESHMVAHISADDATFERSHTNLD